MVIVGSGSQIEKSDVYINKCQRECVIQCQILSLWVVMLLLTVETRLSSSSSPCSERLGMRLTDDLLPIQWYKVKGYWIETVFTNVSFYP